LKDEYAVCSIRNRRLKPFLLESRLAFTVAAGLRAQNAQIGMEYRPADSGKDQTMKNSRAAGGGRFPRKTIAFRPTMNRFVKAVRP